MKLVARGLSWPTCAFTLDSSWLVQRLPRNCLFFFLQLVWLSVTHFLLLCDSLPFYTYAQSVLEWSCQERATKWPCCQITHAVMSHPKIWAAKWEWQWVRNKYTKGELFERRNRASSSVANKVMAPWNRLCWNRVMVLTFLPLFEPVHRNGEGHTTSSLPWLTGWMPFKEIHWQASPALRKLLVAVFQRLRVK